MNAKPNGFVLRARGGGARMAFEERRRRLGGSSVTDARWHSGHSYTPETEDLPSCVQLYKVSEQ